MRGSGNESEQKRRKVRASADEAAVVLLGNIPIDETLPLEVLERVVLGVGDVRTLLAFAQVNKVFAFLARMPRVWRLLYKKDFPGDYAMFYDKETDFCIWGNDNWKQLYLWTQFYTNLMVGLIRTAIRQKKFNMAWYALLDSNQSIDADLILRKSATELLKHERLMVPRVAGSPNASERLNFVESLNVLDTQSRVPVGMGIGTVVDVLEYRYGFIERGINPMQTPLYRSILNVIWAQHKRRLDNLKAMINGKMGIVALVYLTTTYVEGNFVLSHNYSKSTNAAIKHMSTVLHKVLMPSFGSITNYLKMQRVRLDSLHSMLEPTQNAWVRDLYHQETTEPFRYKVMRYIDAVTYSIDEYEDQYPDIIRTAFLPSTENVTQDQMLRLVVFVYESVSEHLERNMNNKYDDIVMMARAYSNAFKNWKASEYPRAKYTERILLFA